MTNKGIINKRFQYGKRSFAPSGSPRRIGSKRYKGFGRVEEYGAARTISLLVGQNKGNEPRNTDGACKRKPTRFTVDDVDRAFFRLRAAQVGREFVGATAQSGRGWFEGDPESSIAFEIAYIPPEGGGPPNEATFKEFQDNMNRLAESMAEDLCQDSVLIIRDDGDKRSVAAAVWEEDE